MLLAAFVLFSFGAYAKENESYYINRNLEYIGIDDKGNANMHIFVDKDSLKQYFKNDTRFMTYSLIAVNMNEAQSIELVVLVMPLKDKEWYWCYEKILDNGVVKKTIDRKNWRYFDLDKRTFIENSFLYLLSNAAKIAMD